MPSTEKLKKKLLNKLTELFHLDQPDLDFGFYRIMQAKAEQVKSFIDKDLLQFIEDAFGQVNEGRKAECLIAYEKALQTAKDFGAPNPEETEPVKKAKAELDALKDGAMAETDVYDHLHRFFERYYDEGDFISRRYYAQENAGKAAPFAIPYNGEEVKLHWANADQYYIKTAEYFSNYSFDITQAAEIRKMSDEEKILKGFPNSPLKIHFRIIDASEDEHGNIKAAEDKKRFFVLYEDSPVELNEQDELVINFEYKALPNGKNEVDSDTEMELKKHYGKNLNKGFMPNLAIAHKVINAVAKIEKAKTYIRALTLNAPTDTISNRPLLVKYINQYTARNTCDYFIHKDLKGFLKRELDFYIKNEVMHLDDIENADALAVESYLTKLKVIRKIATKLIEFLAQLEDFQKRLWLKKKFVTETNYCITLDRVPEALYPEIAANDAQRVEWVKLFAIDEIEANDGDLLNVGKQGYSAPLTVEFLKQNDKLVLDTAFFSDEFKVSLVESIEDFDEQSDGLLINSDNFHALNFITERFSKQFDGIYIDPPYNTSSSEIIYKNSYKHSSWLSLIQTRVELAKALHSGVGIICVTIDDVELPKLWTLLAEEYGWENHLGTAVIRINPGGRKAKRKLALQHEYALFFAPSFQTVVSKLPIEPEMKTHSYKQDLDGLWYEERNLRKEGQDSLAKPGAARFYPIYFDPKTGKLSTIEKFSVEILPIDTDGQKRIWRRDKSVIDDMSASGDLFVKETRNGRQIYFKFRGGVEGETPKSFWDDVKYSASEHGTKILDNLMGRLESFSFPKSPYAVRDCINVMSDSKYSQVLDFFAGSGTTGEAVINLNREDNGKRKYALVEMGDYFSTTTKPRITKVIYSSCWKNGKPTSHDTGISHCFKYLRLESYEDTLNNLVFDENPIRNRVMEQNPTLREDYMLRYILNVETRGSQSLLNIDNIADPTAYTLKVKKPGSDAQVTKHIDLIETFNYLIGLRVTHCAAPQTFTATFTRNPDPELPEDQHTKLVVDGKIKQIQNQQSEIENPVWWFRKIEGWVPSDPMNPSNGKREKVLIIWRKLTGNLEEDNLMLDEWLQKYRISTRDFEYDTIYVNGSNNLTNLKKDDENWKVRLIEETFHKKMWEVEGEA